MGGGRRGRRGRTSVGGFRRAGGRGPSRGSVRSMGQLRRYRGRIRGRARIDVATASRSRTGASEAHRCSSRKGALGAALIRVVTLVVTRERKSDSVREAKSAQRGVVGG